MRNERERGTGAERMRAWFTRPPYPGAWILGVVLLLPVEALVLRRMWSPPAAARLADAPPPTVTVIPPPTATVTPTENSPADAPQVTVHSLPPRAVPPVPSHTAPNGPQMNAPPANAPGASPRAPAGFNVPAPAPNAPAAPNGGSFEVFVPNPANAPEPAPRPVAPEVRPAPETRSPRPAPEARPVPEPRATREAATPDTSRAVPDAPRSAPEPRRSRRRGLMTIYFDADSSTYARHHERLPLRVEVFVDGVKRLVTDDPEKRQFEVGELTEGRHEVAIVPYVADYPPDPLREVIQISPGQVNDFKAVLRKSHDVSRVGKFEARD